MKKILLILLLLPTALFSQYLRFPSTYDSETTAKEICKGDIKKFLSDTVEWIVEKKNNRWITYERDKDQANSGLNKIFSQGLPQYSSRTQAGYWFYISVFDPKDDSRIIQTVKFEVNPYTQKIVLIEIQKKEK